jgi:hypothetical protein
VIYADGGGGHPFNRHLDKLDSLMKKAWAWSAFTTAWKSPRKSGKKFLDWTGGYFEANWSVNPHWTPITTSCPSTRSPMA